MTIVDARVAVWTSASGVPLRLIWDGRRYTVSDQPTRLDAELDYAMLTHLPPMPVGWRFQATNSETHDTRVFDVRLVDAARHLWRLVQVYS